MRNATGAPRRHWVSAAIIAWLSLSALSACTSIQGYPSDPENLAIALARVDQYFNGVAENDYLNATTDADKTPKRNRIIYGRMRAYDLEFADFERSLYSQGNAIAVGSDLIALILGGFTATTGNAATKAALGAASVGILGANTAINKDLYYQKTIVALLAQMEANRARARIPILQGLTLPDAQYSLMQAYLDLDAYKNAGSIPGAISVITQNAETDKQDAQVVLSGINLESASVNERHTKLAQYMQSLVAKNDVDTLTRIAKMLDVTFPPGSKAPRIKARILEKINLLVAGKKSEADQQAALESLAQTLKDFVKF